MRGCIVSVTVVYVSTSSLWNKHLSKAKPQIEVTRCIYWLKLYRCKERNRNSKIKAKAELFGLGKISVCVADGWLFPTAAAALVHTYFLSRSCEWSGASARVHAGPDRIRMPWTHYTPTALWFSGRSHIRYINEASVVRSEQIETATRPVNTVQFIFFKITSALRARWRQDYR